jgi:hypothetical protein
MVRYGSAHLTCWNIKRFIGTKWLEFAHVREVRAALWISDAFAGVNRHSDIENRPYDRPLTRPPTDRLPDGVTRTVDVEPLVTDVVLSPWISDAQRQAVEQLLSRRPVHPYAGFGSHALLRLLALAAVGDGRVGIPSSHAGQIG